MKKMTAILVTLCMLAALLAGCGGASKSTQAFDAAAAAPAEAANGAYYDMESAKSEDGGLTGDTDSTVLPEGRKWIITVNMSAETEDLDALMEALNGKISGLGGYVEDQDSYNGSMYSSRRYRSASLTVRIPAERVDEFTEEMSGIANVVSTNLSREDITLSYVATESRVKALQTEEARLLELMEQAETMADLLEIESRLTDVRYELENRASQLRLYDNQVDYATIYLSIDEVQEYTPVEEPTVWERISGGFVSSVKGVGNGLLDLLVWVLAKSPYLVILGGVTVGVVVLIKKRKARKAAKKAAKQNPTEESKSVRVPPGAPFGAPGIYFGMVMVSTIWLSVSRRSDTAGMPDSWIFCRDWVRLLRNAPTLALDGLSARADRSVSTYFSVRATLMPCRTISFTAASLHSSVGSFRSARAWRSVSPASRRASSTGSLCFSSRSLLATALWLLPRSRAACS